MFSQISLKISHPTYKLVPIHKLIFLSKIEEKKKKEKKEETAHLQSHNNNLFPMKAHRRSARTVGRKTIVETWPR